MQLSHENNSLWSLYNCTVTLDFYLKNINISLICDAWIYDFCLWMYINVTLMEGFSVCASCWLLTCHSSHSGAVSVRWTVEVLPADHTGNPWRGPPPYEGRLPMNTGRHSVWLDVMFFVTCVFCVFQVALLDLQSNSKIAALLPYFVYVISGVCFSCDIVPKRSFFTI